jgi:MoaA/NifB/PqqE/SkfB family radical SAM enzyme
MPILILAPHSRCNCRCVMCDIWKVADTREISADDLEQHVEGIERLGVQWTVFTGGEPLMHSDLFRLCRILRRRGIRVSVLSTGLLLERHAAAIAENVDDVIVSLDGPSEIHDRIRRVPGAFGMLEAGVHAIRRIQRDFPLSARCTVQRINYRHLRATLAAAREIGLNGISFLAADLTSAAFNRPQGWTTERSASVGLFAEDLPALETEIEALIDMRECASEECGGFVAESPQKLRRIVSHFRGIAAAPTCNAPWVSAVLEADGVVRPCFFHPPIGRVDGNNTLFHVINGAQGVAFRASLDVASDPICRRCICSLNWRGPVADY